MQLTTDPERRVLRYMKTYKFYSDPGHGWCAVKKKELEQLGISDKISAFSYMRGQTAYLEEDDDFTTFCEAKKAAGQEFKKDWHVDEVYYERSPIRNYDFYEAEVTV